MKFLTTVNILCIKSPECTHPIKVKFGFLTYISCKGRVFLDESECLQMQLSSGHKRSRVTVSMSISFLKNYKPTKQKHLACLPCLFIVLTGYARDFVDVMMYVYGTNTCFEITSSTGKWNHARISENISLHWPKEVGSEPLVHQGQSKF